MLALEEFQKRAIHWLLRFFANQRSVFGGTVPSADWSVAQHRTMMVVYPVGTLKDLIEIYLFVAALFTTKELVRMVLKEQRPEINEAVHGIGYRYREVLLFSIKYMAVMAALGAVLMLLASAPLRPDLLRHLLMSKAFISIFALAGECCLAWLLVPAAIRLLRLPGGPPVSAQHRKMGTVFAVATSAVSIALEYLVGRTEATFRPDSSWEGLLVAVVNTVVINAPQVMLFIALALLAIQEAPDGNLRMPGH